MALLQLDETEQLEAVDESTASQMLAKVSSAQPPPNMTLAEVWTQDQTCDACQSVK